MGSFETASLERDLEAPRLAIVIGTRPEIIKLAPVIKACHDRGVPYELIHTGQHYSHEMDSLILKDLELPPPHHNLGIGSGSHAEETARALVGTEGLFRKISPKLVLVQGDTNSALAAALAASKLHLKVGHVEAGLRSFDGEMPEETNRILTDHLSDILFAPTEVSTNNLVSEGISHDKIRTTGNTIVDTINFAFDLIRNNRTHSKRPDYIPDEDFFLLTLHREENVDSAGRMRAILKGVSSASEKFGLKTMFPAHPRTVKRMKQFGLDTPSNLVIGRPEGYLRFLQLEQHAELILTDSGGVQEEACVLKVPCVTLRNNTERPETVKVGANLLTGTEADAVVRGVSAMIDRSRDWVNPLGDGQASQRILDAATEGDSGLN
jgi:UDP-N-acetylglucosamine 2-epimerase (non-hydrolysing)